MSEEKKRLPMFGKEIDVADVPIVRASEFFNEYELEDGSKVKVKNVATSILRVENQFTPDGKPVYLVISSPVLTVVSSKLGPPSAGKGVNDVKPN
jgi:hypothetical protein